MATEDIRRHWRRFCEKQDTTGVVSWYATLPGDEALPPYVKQLLFDRAQHLNRTRQYEISLTKFLHGFNVTDIRKDLGYLRGEVQEVEDAIAEGNPDHICEELADVAIYCYGMSQMLGLNLDEMIERKMQYNAERKYPTDLE